MTIRIKRLKEIISFVEDLSDKESVLLKKISFSKIKRTIKPKTPKKQKKER